MSATPAKRKPLIFKRRAGPVSKAPIDPFSSDSDADPNATAVPRPTKATATATTTATATAAADDHDQAAVDLFRRAKQFFPRALEEQTQRARAQKQLHRRPPPPAQATERTPVSTPEPPDHDTKRRKVLDEEPRHRTASTPEPRRPASAGKGKAIATPHAVNAQIVFSSGSSVQQTDVPSDPAEPAMESPALRATIAEIKAEEDTLEALRARTTPVSAVPKTLFTANAPHRRPLLKQEAVLVEGRFRDDVVISIDEDDVVREPVPEVEEPAPSPEFNEYILRARAKAAEAAREASQGTPAREVSTLGGSIVTGSQTSNRTSTPTASPGASQTTAASSQHYRIFITARLPVPVPPLIATMRMDQKMHFVQKAFLDHARRKGAPLTDEQAARVVLTWKGIKLYSWTTGHSLDVHPDARGKFRDEEAAALYSGSSSGGSTQHAGFVSGGLHLEIWTAELYQQYQHDQERQRQRKLGEVVDDEPSDDEGATQGEGAAEGAAGDDANPHGPRIRLVLKSKDHEKLSLTAYGDTKVAMLVAAFRDQRKIGPQAMVAIHWDGEQLEENTTVADAEMEDMDNVEVFIH